MRYWATIHKQTQTIPPLVDNTSESAAFDLKDLFWCEGNESNAGQDHQNKRPKGAQEKEGKHATEEIGTSNQSGQGECLSKAERIISLWLLPATKGPRSKGWEKEGDGGLAHNPFMKSIFTRKAAIFSFESYCS